MSPKCQSLFTVIFSQAAPPQCDEKSSYKIMGIIHVQIRPRCTLKRNDQRRRGEERRGGLIRMGEGMGLGGNGDFEKDFFLFSRPLSFSARLGFLKNRYL